VLWNSAVTLKSLKIDSGFIDFRSDFRVELPHLTYLDVTWDNWENTFCSDDLMCPSLEYLRMGSFSEDELPVLQQLSKLTFLGNLSFDKIDLCTSLTSLQSLSFNDTYDEADHIDVLKKFTSLRTIHISGGEDHELDAKLKQFGVTVNWE